MKQELNQFGRRKTRTKRFAYFGMALVVLFSVTGYSLFLKPASKVQAGTKIDDTSNFSFQSATHQVIRTSAGTIYSFVSKPSSGKCEMWKSANGASWSQQDSANAAICSDQEAAIDSSGIIHLLYSGNGPSAANLVYRTFNTGTDTFGTEEVIDSFDDAATDTCLAIDSNNKPHILYHGYSFQGTYYDTFVKYGNRVAGGWGTSNLYAGTPNSPAGIAYSIVINEDNIPEVLYHDNTTYYAGVGNANNPISFTTTTPDSTVYIPTALGIDSGGNTWMLYQDSGTTYMTLKKHNDNDAWGTWQTSVTNSVAATPNLAINGTNIYVFYYSSSNIVYDRYNGSSWLSPTNIDSSPSHLSLSVKWSYYHNNQGSTQIDYLYADGNDVYWNKLDLTSVPAAPTLSLPASGATGQSTSPNFQFRTTDADNDYLQYEIIVYQSNCSTIVRTIDQSSSQTGWTGQDAQSNTAYVGNTTITSSTMASHTYQASALSSSTTYCWKARAKDPGGTNTFGSYSATQSFTTGTNASAAAPTLIAPASGATGVSINPLFQVRTTDADNDYLRYKILIYNSDCSTGLQTFDQTVSQTGWTGQDTQSSTAYVGNSVIGSSTIASFGGASLSASTQYCWKAAAIDPGGTNTYGSYSATQLFTTGTATGNVNINGGTQIRGGTIIR